MKKHDKAIVKETKKRMKKYSQFSKENYDWDYIHIIELLRFKIKRVRKYIKNNNIIEQQKLDEIVGKMKETENLLERVISYDYKDDLKNEFIQKFGGEIKFKLKFTKNHKLKTKKDYSEIKGDQMEEANIEYDKRSDKEFELMKADLKKAFEIMTEHIWDWWD